MKEKLKNLSRWGWNLYEIIIIIGGAIAAILFSLRFSELPIENKDIWIFLCVLFLYILFDLLRAPYKEKTISLGFPIVLFALLGTQANGPLIVAQIVMLGSLSSDMFYRFILQREPLARLDRVLFYTAHHALAALAAMGAFNLILNQQIFLLPDATEAYTLLVDLDYSLAVLVYIIIYSLISLILIAPHDREIQKLRLPVDEEPLPRVHPIGSVVLMAPVPIAIFVFAFTLTGTSRFILLLVFPALFLAFLTLARSYAKIERERSEHISQDEVRGRLLGLTSFNKELLNSVSILVNQRLQRPGRTWIAIYSAPVGNDTLWLRGERDRLGQIQIHQPGRMDQFDADSRPDATMEASGDSDEVRWPPYVRSGQGILGQIVETRSRQSDLVSTTATPKTKEDPRLPTHTAYLYIPLQHQSKVIGLLNLARPRRRFTKDDLDSLAPLVEVLNQTLVNIRGFEKQIEELFVQVEDFVEDPMVVRRALENLIDRGVTRINEIIALILERAFQKRFDHRLKVLAKEDVRGHHSALSDEDLASIYNQVRNQDISGMPKLDDILEDLRKVGTSFSIAYSFPQTLSEQDWSHTYGPLYQVYQIARRVDTINKITDQQGDIQKTRDELKANRNVLPQVILVLDRLLVVIASLKQLERLDSLDSPNEVLENALTDLEAVGKLTKELPGLLRLILFNWRVSWRNVISAVLVTEETEQAKLELTLRSKQALPLKSVDVVLQVQNVGRDVAKRVIVELLPQAGYKILGTSQSNLRELQVYKTKEAEFVIQPQEESKISLVFRISYREGGGTWPRIYSFEDQLRLRGKPLTNRPITNRYMSFRPLVTGHPLFFGRDDVFDEIRKSVALRERQEPQVLAVIGERRIGKTSVAYQLPIRLADEDYIYVYYDLQELMEKHLFLPRLTELIAENLRNKGIAIDLPSRKELQESPTTALENHFLPQLSKRIGDRKLLIAIDEYEKLQQRVESEKEDPAVFGYLRSLIQHKQKIVFIFFGSQQIEDLASDYRDVLFGLTKPIRIGLLEEKDARDLIEEPMEEQMVYDELAIKEIIRGTGGHPLYLQMICGELAASCRKDKVNYVTLRRVRTTLRKIIESAELHLRWLWDSVSEEERLVLAGLAECLSQGKLGKADEIVQEVRRVGKTLELGNAHSALRHLGKRQILVESEQGDFYDFAASLYYDWIRLARPLKQQITA